MSGALDDEAIAVAVDLLDEFGGVCTLTRVATGAYDTATATASVTTTIITAAGAAFDYSLHEIDGTNIHVGDQRLYLSQRDTAGAAVPKPAPGDKVALAGATFKVIASRPLAPSGVTVLHEVQVRAS